jgi:hypothetical protein
MIKNNNSPIVYIGLLLGQSSLAHYCQDYYFIPSIICAVIFGLGLRAYAEKNGRDKD